MATPRQAAAAAAAALRDSSVHDKATKRKVASSSSDEQEMESGENWKVSITERCVWGWDERGTYVLCIDRRLYHVVCSFMLLVLLTRRCLIFEKEDGTVKWG